MNLSQYISDTDLAAAILEGLVKIQEHKTLPLDHYCYTRRAVYDNRWEEATIKCRGLIVNRDTEEIVARPFPKFFNYFAADRPETHPENLPTTQPLIMEKVDGSLGIAYEYAGQHYVASKGSFYSDHALWMTDTYRRLSPNPTWPEGYTPVFEMICEKVQHHVVSYDGRDALCLIGLVNKETGEELVYNDLYHWAYINGLKVPNAFNLSLADAAAVNRQNEEGFVATWHRAGTTPIKVKIKFVEFVRLQRLLHHTRPKHVFEAWSQPHMAVYLREWLHDSTPAFVEFVQKWIKVFQDEYNRIATKATAVFNAAQMEGFTTRKQYAEVFTKTDVAQVLFTMLDGGLVHHVIYKMVGKLAQGGQPLYEED